MSRIWDADTAFVFEKSIAASFSCSYCCAVPSTVFLTPVSDVSMLVAAAIVAPPRIPMAGVTVLVRVEPTDLSLSPADWYLSPKSVSDAPALPMRVLALESSILAFASWFVNVSSLLSHVAISA